MKNYLSKNLTTRTLFDIQHSKKFVIDIDSDDGKMTADKAIVKIQQAFKRRSIRGRKSVVLQNRFSEMVTNKKPAAKMMGKPVPSKSVVVINP